MDSFRQLGKSGAAIWPPHNLDVWINIQLDKYNSGLDLRLLLLLAACRQFNPPTVHFVVHRHNKLYLFEQVQLQTHICEWAPPTFKDKEEWREKTHLST
ncbi:Hypothetical predicted protein [Xyrichtys novacula]|uniref:Uncharacterized protein n=1 Tax=Xyrichtys novacula TaxID=13765 RepID=A0AAV1GZB9_XYRNO|nr:Hypothetical predicted protein [Xyrichtys novacula]